MNEDPHGAADRIDRKTQRILRASGIAFIGWQVAYFATWSEPGPVLRSVDIVRSIGFIAWSGALLYLVATGGGAFAGRRTRAILDDELAQARRAHAYRNAFWVMTAIALIGYALAQLTHIHAVHLAHLTLSAGVLAAVVTTAYLGRR